ncbi:hypothetical protein ACEWY4_010556 [Coilia grayii]|uniref:C2 domain-containing protein n=1 Tax=Coilia grayii TaxID=363190 RepID=A0ABD1K295_9TELE
MSGIAPYPNITHVIESPRRDDASSAPPRCGHVSRPSEVLVCVTMHGATNLLPLGDGGVPRPFASLAVGTDEARGRQSRGVTRGTLQPTHSPSWEDTLVVELQDEQAHGDELVLSVADSESRELLAYYRLPVAHLRPFQHYHLELLQFSGGELECSSCNSYCRCVVAFLAACYCHIRAFPILNLNSAQQSSQTHPAVPSGVRLYVSMVLKTSVLPRQPCFSFTGFEVLLEAVTSPLRNPVGPLLAVARIVADYDSYRDTVLLRTPSVAGIAVTSILFPDPPEDAFSVSPITIHGRPQVSPAGSPQERPVWSHSFLFLGRDSATVFTEGAALVLELYPTTTVMNSVSWHLRSPVGFCVLFLDQSLYRKLMTEPGHRGFRVPQLPLQGGHLHTTTGSAPAVSIALRLIGSEASDQTMKNHPKNSAVL